MGAASGPPSPRLASVDCLLEAKRGPAWKWERKPSSFLEANPANRALQVPPPRGHPGPRRCLNLTVPFPDPLPPDPIPMSPWSRGLISLSHRKPWLSAPAVGEPDPNNPKGRTRASEGEL